MIGRRRVAFWRPPQAAASLVELAFIERSIAHIMAGWAVKMPMFEAKLEFGMQMHRSIERSTYLRSRVNGLCYAVGGEARFAAGLRSAMARLDQAQTAPDLLFAVYRWLFPRLIRLYQEHLRHTDPDGDRASVELIASFLPALKKERRRGLGILRTARGPKTKALVRELDVLWSLRSQGEPLTLDDGLWAPSDRVPAAVRPDGLRFCEPGSLGLLPIDPLRDPKDIGMFLHKELDEEYTTLELIARNSYEHPDMPWAFHRDMARQASDEARHALIITRLMAARGIRHGDFPVSTSSYDGIYEFEPCAPGSRDELLWRMLIRQTFEEGLAIDNLAYEIDRRRAAGQEDIAAGFEYILRDEVFHARSGLHWSNELLGSDQEAAREARKQAIDHFTGRAEAAREAFVIDNLDHAMSELAAIHDARRSRAGKAPDRPLNRTGRMQAGYSDEDIDQVVKWGYAVDEADLDPARAAIS